MAEQKQRKRRKVEKSVSFYPFRRLEDPSCSATEHNPLLREIEKIVTEYLGHRCENCKLNFGPFNPLGDFIHIKPWDFIVRSIMDELRCIWCAVKHVEFGRVCVLPGKENLGLLSLNSRGVFRMSEWYFACVVNMEECLEEGKNFLEPEEVKQFRGVVNELKQRKSRVYVEQMFASRYLSPLEVTILFREIVIHRHTAFNNRALCGLIVGLLGEPTNK